jgi:hypothetical protein
MIRNRAIGRRIGDAPLYVPGEPLFSFSQDPRVASNPNPIYAPGSPQYLAAVAAGAVDPNSGRTYAPVPAVLPDGGSLSLNPGATTIPAATPAAAIPAATAIPAAAISSLSSVPWYYWAGGAAALLLLFFSGKK